MKDVPHPSFFICSRFCTRIGFCRCRIFLVVDVLFVVFDDLLVVEVLFVVLDDLLVEEDLLLVDDEVLLVLVPLF